jgi:G2/mitotic-specific cyclin 2
MSSIPVRDSLSDLVNSSWDIFFLLHLHIKIKRTTTRVTRSAKDAENINARPSRLTTRAKSALAAGSGASTAIAATAAVTTRATASTAASKTKSVASNTTEAAGAKRKRDVLVEVTGLVTNHKGKSTGEAGGLKGKEKGAARNTTATARTTKAAVKPSVKTGGVTLRRVPRSASESTVTSNSKTDTNGTALELDEKMEVDDPLDDPPPPPVASSVSSKRLSRMVGEEDLGRVFKRRHTEKKELAVKELETLDESQADVDKVAADLVEEIAPPSVQLWDDLDAEDWDDPVMVSEYVADVCVYLKQVEVRILSFNLFAGIWY